MSAEYYDVRAVRGNYPHLIPHPADGANYITNPQTRDEWDRENTTSVRVLADHHEQHIWNSTTLCGVSASGAAKLAELRAKGYALEVLIAGQYIHLDGER